MVKIINIDTKTKTIRISNADGDIKAWRTTESGTHFPIREGESTKEALDKFLEKKGKRYYRGSVLHKDIIDDLGKASAKSDENVKYWESEVDKENKRKRKTPGYLDFAQKNIESWKAQAETQRAKAKELSGDFEIDPDDADLNKEFEEWKKSKEPAQATQQPAKKEPTVADRLNEGGWDNYGQWKPIRSGSHYYFRDEKNWAKRDYSYMYVPENDNDLQNYGEIEEDTFERDFVTARIYENGKVVAKEKFDGADTKRDNMDFAIDYVVSHFKNKKKQDATHPEGDQVTGSYENTEAIRQDLWAKGYATDNEGDGDYGDTGTEYVWKDGTMYAVNITKNPDGSVSAKQSSMGEVSRSEFNDYLDEIHNDDDDEEEDDETDSDISGIESRGEAANWLNAMTRKHGNTYFWSGNMKSALNKLVEKFGNTYFWNK